MSKQSSILSFFHKSPKTSAKKLDKCDGSIVKSNDLITKTPKAKVALSERLQNTSAKKNKRNDLTKEEEAFIELDIVWARLEGYPHWPAIVCKHPVSQVHQRKIASHPNVHVQFFDEPPQRAWIKQVDCERMVDAKHPKLDKIKDDKLKQAIDWALEALELPITERNSLIVKMTDNDEHQTEVENIKNRKRKRSVSSTNSSFDQKRLKEESLSELSDVSEPEVDDDNDYDDYKPKKDEISSESESDASLDVSDDISSGSEPELSDEEIVETKKTATKAKFTRSFVKANTKSAKKTIKSFKRTLNQSNNFGLRDEFEEANRGGINLMEKQWPHLSFDFLKPENIKDKNGRRPDHPDYDASTLYVPEVFIKNQTPAHRQWWKVKADHFDKLLFFKMGKFYELFHMDAVVICSELNLMYMRGNYAHAGFPEISYRRFAQRLIERNHKVVRIEQTETPQARDERCKAMKVKDKVVSREVCRITSKGTRTLNVLDNDMDTPQSLFLLSITEKVVRADTSEFGVCLIDTSIGRFYAGQFIDDKCLSALRTIFAHFPPAEILLEKHAVTKRTQSVIKNCVPNAIVTIINSSKFWTARTTLKYLMEGKIYENSDKKVDLPPSLKNMLDPSDPLNLTARPDFEMGISAFGAVVSYLKECLIDEELLSLRLFSEFKGAESLTEAAAAANNENVSFMILDSVGLKNLEIFENSCGGTEGTLFETVNLCQTSFGKRRLRSWICSPLYSKKAINQRLDAVQQLMRINLTEVRNKLKGLPDLERLLSKMHSQASYRKSKFHPEARAVMFEAKNYNKRKINDFISLIDAFRRCESIVRDLNEFRDDLEASLLRNCITYQEEGGMFPRLEEKLAFFDKAFDHKIAKTEGKIVPCKNVNMPYEEACERIANVKKRLDTYLSKECRKFNASIKYAHTIKQPYQLEFPEALARKADQSYELQTTRKGFKRFYTDELKELLQELKQYEDEKQVAMEESMRLIFEHFDRNYGLWVRAINCISLIDCLLGFAAFATALRKQTDVCRPKFVDIEEKGPVLRMSNAKHPALLKYCDNYIANDLFMDDHLLLVTGPNMGGKSTLMRQTALIIILAQIGCYVPASECEMTLVDRIFTRLGAKDRIMENESTFFVELSETAIVLKNASRNSLVLLDELGRGTSTFDGTAIAYSVARYLAERIRCSTIFSTHYHSLVEDFRNSDRVLFKHMACQVENENSEDPTQESITFLYKLVDGVCPKSHGFNAAQLANIPRHIVKRGYEQAKLAEKQIDKHKLLYKLMNHKIEKDEMRRLVSCA